MTDTAQQMSILASIISEYVLDNGVADAADAKAVASRIYHAGFRITGMDGSLESRLNSIEQRLSAVEGWCGLSRQVVLHGLE